MRPKLTNYKWYLFAKLAEKANHENEMGQQNVHAIWSEIVWQRERELREREMSLLAG